MSAPEQQQTATTNPTPIPTREVVTYASIHSALRKGRVVTATISDVHGDRTCDVVHVLRSGLGPVVQCDDGMWWSVGSQALATSDSQCQAWRTVVVSAATRRTKK